jgi:hypothetical protein
MPKPLRKRDPNRHADRFYDYLIAHKGEVLRYVTAALVTALIQYLLRLFFDQTGMIAFVVRFFLLFYILKYWVYREIGFGAFYTGRQLMLAIMIILVGTVIFNYLIVLLADLTGRPMLIGYTIQAIMEIFYFIIYQFLIFKEPKND